MRQTEELNRGISSHSNKIPLLFETAVEGVAALTPKTKAKKTEAGQKITTAERRFYHPF